jgi:putative membrane protein
MADEGAQFPLDVQPSVGNQFAWLRTLLGLQRTLMAAVRTAVSLIGFGFTVAQFFDKLRGNAPAGAPMMSVDVARDLGLVLIGAGVLSLIVFTVQYHLAVAYLKSDQFRAIAPTAERALHKPTYLVAITVVLIGVAAFFSVLLRF